MLTPIKIEDVLSWLEQFDDDVLVGHARSAFRCPFVKFLGPKWFVFTNESTQKGEKYENPEWMAQCIDYIDSTNETSSEITKKQFYDALRKRS